MDEVAKEPDDKPLLITAKQERIFGQKEGFDVLMLMWFFFGDYLIKVGPIMYILQVWSTGFPIPVTVETRIFAALYDEEHYQAAVDHGKTKEGKFPFYFYFAAQQYYQTHKNEYGGFGFTLQTDFSNSLKKRYAATIPVRWIHTELFSQHWPDDEGELPE
ncbi:MAG: hypothetical protein QME78_00090 [Thermodesulfobacteriota bacterium]|nr:hypothetical protein [Thermodesulfobacteriota bacterium]